MDIRGKGVDFNRIREIINEVSRNSWNGEVILHADAKPLGTGAKNPNYGFRGRIVATNGRSIAARRSWSGRRTNAACWHAYRDVLRAILTEYPDAIVSTALARYEGLAGFEETYPHTVNKNIGSVVAPAYMDELCNHD